MQLLFNICPCGSELRRAEDNKCTQCRWKYTPTGVFYKCTYKSAHRRVKRVRGAAKEYVCLGCGSPAEEWSYRGNSPEEITGEVYKYKKSVKYTMIMAWSPNVNDYDPLCRECHRARDMGS